MTLHHLPAKFYVKIGKKMPETRKEKALCGKLHRCNLQISREDDTMQVFKLNVSGLPGMVPKTVPVGAGAVFRFIKFVATFSYNERDPA